MTVSTLPYHPPAHPHLRRFDLRRDLAPVADLIEVCFAETLDEEGRRYIRQMRFSARSRGMMHLAGLSPARALAPYSGFVWEEDGRVVGNLSHFPVPARGRRIFLIANVAVHPQYRRKGIARALTEAALHDSSQRKADATWLHVREENATAFHLYRSLGFVERTRRTTWVAAAFHESLPAVFDPIVGPRRREHWPQQERWFAQIHPPMLDWYLPFKRAALRPGLAGFFSRLLEDARLKQWSATRQGQLLGVLVWQRTQGHADRLWLVSSPEHEDAAIPALLTYARWEVPFRRKLSLEYPAGRGVHALEGMGFSLEQTLIWMEHRT